MHSWAAKSSYRNKNRTISFMFIIAPKRLGFVNLFVFFFSVSDGSGWLGGLPWWWGWRGRWRWRRAVSEEAAPSELLRLNVLCLVEVEGKASPSRPPSSGRLIGPWPACAICQSHGGDGNSQAPDSLCSSWSLLLFSSLVEDEEPLSFFFLFLTSVPMAHWFYLSPLTNLPFTYDRGS